MSSIPKLFPVVVKKGNSTVKIYRAENGGYDEFTVSFYLAGKRKREVFSDYGSAKVRADGINESVANGEIAALTLSADDRILYLRSLEALKPSGVAIDRAVNDYAAAFKILEGRSILDAARYYAKAVPSSAPRRTVAEVVTEFLAAKEKIGRSKRYLEDIKHRCGKFEKAFACQISSVTAEDVKAFLDSLKIGQRTERNYLLMLRTLFAWAKKKPRQYLPQDFDILSGFESSSGGEGAIEIYTPAEMAELLARADVVMLPFLAIGGFAGLRSQEIQRLDWSEVNLVDGFIEIKAGKAKTATRRLAPITPNLSAWLAPYAQKSGPVMPYDNLSFFFAKLCAEERDAKGRLTRKALTWKANALRASFISYRVADTQNVSQVALEAGNSPKKIFSNYRELVTKQQASAWFSISPQVSEKVLPMVATA